MIQVIERIGHVLDAFAARRRSLTLTEVVEDVGLAKSTVHRLLVSMEKVGFVERQGQLWRVGPRAVELATIRLGEFDLRSEALPLLRALSVKFRAAGSFSLPDGIEMVYVERVDPPTAVGASARLGARAPMWAGGSGRAFLASLPEAECEQILQDPAFQALPSEARERVRRELVETREQGYCVDLNFFYPGVAGVCLAIRDISGRPVAAMSLLYPADRGVTDVPRIAEQLLAGRERLEAMLGVRGRLSPS